MSFALYLFGFVLVTMGVAWGLAEAGVPRVWIGIAVVILLGLGFVMGVSRTRMKDPPAA